MSVANGPSDPKSWDFLALGGAPINEHTIRTIGLPVRAFAELVVGSDEAAAQILAADEFDVPKLLETMERLIISEKEEDQERFDALADFATQTRHIFPRQFPDVVDSLSSSVEPMVRGTAAFSLPYLVGVDKTRAIEIWSRLLTDTHPKVLEAAVIVWREETGEGYPRDSRKRKSDLGRRDKRQLRPKIQAAENRLADIGRPLP